MKTVLPGLSGNFLLRTPRLLLRPPEQKDAETLLRLMSDARISTYLAWEPHKSLQETVELITALNSAQASGKGFHWIIENQGNTVGLTSIIDVWWQHRCWTLNRAELAYWISPDAQGRGFATEAATAVMKLAFTRLSFNKLRVYHAAENAISGRVVAKLGFRLVGTERKAFFKNNRWHDMQHYEMLASEFRQHHLT
jgi:RimJ/RimL family protein N-acetyltransferase